MSSALLQWVACYSRHYNISANEHCRLTLLSGTSTLTLHHSSSSWPALYHGSRSLHDTNKCSTIKFQLIWHLKKEGRPQLNFSTMYTKYSHNVDRPSPRQTLQHQHQAAPAATYSSINILYSNSNILQQQHAQQVNDNKPHLRRLSEWSDRHISPPKNSAERPNDPCTNLLPTRASNCV